MSLDEKDSPAVLTITRPTPSRQPSNRSDVLATIEDVESSHSVTPTLTPTATHEAESKNSPFSPFYRHSQTQSSLDALKSESKQNINVYDNDVEACLTKSKTNSLSPQQTGKTFGMTRTNKSCTVWPGTQQLKEQNKAARRARMNKYNPMRNLDKKTKVWVKIAIALVVIGLILGVGLGISKAVGGGIWKNSTNTNVSTS
jgi:hypothetical protein